MKSEKHNVFIEEINKISFSSNDDKRTQSIDSIETYAYGTSKDLVSKEEGIKCNNITKNTKISNFGDVTKENIKEHNLNWPKIPDHPNGILIIVGSESGKSNSLFNLIKSILIKLIYMNF